MAVTNAALACEAPDHDGVSLSDAVSLSIVLSGRLDVTTAAECRAELVTALEAAPAVGDFVVQLGGVESVDLVGLGLLVGVHRRAQRAGRRLVLADPPASLRRLMLATRLHRVLAVAP